MKLAAIDIGSNAIRLLINDITTYKDGSFDYTKVNLIRVPLRLGFEVFESGTISEFKKEKLAETLLAFKHLINVYQVQHTKICATSAMRDATNKNEVLAFVKKKTGFVIEIITGDREAEILYETHFADKLNSRKNYLYIDVGGGSTELSLFSKNILVNKKSFNIGTIRILQNSVEESQWEEMKKFVKLQSKNHDPLIAIGSGGNINKLFSISKLKQGQLLSLDKLKIYYQEMKILSVAERIHKYGFREDRADVIVPAMKIYLQILRWGNISQIAVPQIGLADGLIKLAHKDLLVNSLMGKK